MNGKITPFHTKLSCSQPLNCSIFHRHVTVICFFIIMLGILFDGNCISELSSNRLMPVLQTCSLIRSVTMRIQNVVPTCTQGRALV